MTKETTLPKEIHDKREAFKSGVSFGARQCNGDDCKVATYWSIEKEAKRLYPHREEKRRLIQVTTTRGICELYAEEGTVFFRFSSMIGVMPLANIATNGPFFTPYILEQIISLLTNPTETIEL